MDTALRLVLVSSMVTVVSLVAPSLGLAQDDEPGLQSKSGRLLASPLCSAVLATLPRQESNQSVHASKVEAYAYWVGGAATVLSAVATFVVSESTTDNDGAVVMTAAIGSALSVLSTGFGRYWAGNHDPNVVGLPSVYEDGILERTAAYETTCFDSKGNKRTGMDVVCETHLKGLNAYCCSVATSLSWKNSLSERCEESLKELAIESDSDSDS
ncbi:MAG: hypothetical protein AAFQ77_03060 [Myxococcota bacterium]